MPIDSNQYDSAIDFISDQSYSRTVGNLSNNDDKLRLKAYELYENFYHNRPEHIRVVLRGEDDDSVEIYIPSAKKYVEAVNRFLAVDFNYAIDPDSGGGEIQRSRVDAGLANLFKREKVITKYNNMKRYMLIKGDALLHVVGHPWERAGFRIKVQELKPEHYFPIDNPVTGLVMGCHIVDVIPNPKNSPRTKRYTGKYVVRRQTYRKVVTPLNVPTGEVTSELTLWEIGAWDDRMPDMRLKQVDVVQEEFTLPTPIQDLPVYHWTNRPPPGSSFGMSLLAGSESIINAINQAATDEDLTLITQGLGVYWTDASPPTDANGNETEWEIGPGSVVQIAAGGNFNRVSGVSTVAPYHEHIKMLDEQAQQGIGVPDIAIGMVDVQTAESGIALQLKLGPMLAANAETELPMVDETDEFLYDLVNGFLPAYEGIESGGVIANTEFGDPMPVNQKDELQKLIDAYTNFPSTLPVEFLYEKLNEIMGWELDYNTDFDQALEDATRIADTAAGTAFQNEGNMDQQFDEDGNPIEQFEPEKPPPGSQGGKKMSFAGL